MRRLVRRLNCGGRFLRGDSGYATVVAAGIIAALAGLLLVVAAAGGRVAARHEAQVAADMAAVAAAWDLAAGRDACSVARSTAELNGAAVSSCREDDRDVVVTTRVRGREATSRAGPV